MTGKVELTAAVVVGVAVVATVAVTVTLAVRLVRVRRALTRAGVPIGNKLAFWGALLYVVSPVDLLPDPIYLDDIGVLMLALRSLHAAAARAGLREGDLGPGLDADPGRGYGPVRGKPRGRRAR
jgi:uncharacterized membrane protein YkvA (DUF1232 family)